MPKVNVNVTIPKKTEPAPQQADVVWPTMLEDEEEEDTLVELTFYDYFTWKGEDGNWYDVADVNNDDFMSLIWTAEKTFSDQKPYFIHPTHTTWEVRGNLDSKVRPQTIIDEFGPTNPDRWERKPLASRPEEWRGDGHRWYAGGTYIMIDPDSGDSVVKSDFSQFNIRCELRGSPDSEPAGRIDPDLYHDGAAKRLKMKFPQNINEIKPLIYRGNFSGKQGIKIKDQSKSFGHYVSGSGLTYTFDWIDGIYWCPFDTSDEEKFKVTTDPSYSSQEVNGRFILPGKYDVGLIPRRWLYEFRYHHQLNPKTDYVDHDYSGLNEQCKNHLESFFYHVDNQLLKCDFTESTSVMRGYKVESKHYVAYFWGRWPCNMTPRWGHEEGTEQFESTAPVMFWNPDHTAQIGTADLVWGETYLEAQQHWTQAGGEIDEIEHMLTGSLSCDLHVCSDATPDYLVKIGSPDAVESWGTLYQIAETSYGGPVITRSEAGHAYEGFSPVMESPFFGIQQLWDVIESTDYWQNTINPLRQAAIAMTDTNSAASRIDMIPWGVGVSPSKAGDLVGVIRQRDKAWFIWRRTDEEITPKQVGGSTNPIRFESALSTGAIGAFTEGDKYGENLYDADFCDLFLGDGARKITHVGREIESVNGDLDEDCTFLYRTHAEGESEGAVELDAPVFVMLTKEHAFDDINWSLYEFDTEGPNSGLNGRCARCNDFSQYSAAIRNGF